jgi:hypothetical protein
LPQEERIIAMAKATEARADVQSEERIAVLLMGKLL